MSQSPVELDVVLAVLLTVLAALALAALGRED
jgi:hypothetical protein